MQNEKCSKKTKVSFDAFKELMMAKLLSENPRRPVVVSKTKRKKKKSTVKRKRKKVRVTTVAKKAKSENSPPPVPVVPRPPTPMVSPTPYVNYLGGPSQPNPIGHVGHHAYMSPLYANRSFTR